MDFQLCLEHAGFLMNFISISFQMPPSNYTIPGLTKKNKIILYLVKKYFSCKYSFFNVSTFNNLYTIAYLYASIHSMLLAFYYGNSFISK
jgi:hypothetical protein